MKKVILLVLIVSLFLYGCDKLFPSKRKPVEPVQQQPTIRISGPVLAQVNDWAIGADDFKLYLENLKTLTKAQYDIDLDVESYDIKREALNDLVRKQILAQVAKERGYDKDEDILKTLRDANTNLLVSKLQTELEKNADVSYQEVKSFYDQNKDTLQGIKQPYEIKVREIGVNSETQAKEVYINLLQGGSFSSLARTYSVLDSKDQGGDLGYISYDPEKKFKKFWKVSLTLDKGATSSIFKGEDGKYYIVKVEDIRGGEVKPFAEVEKQLKEALKIQKIQGEMNKLVDGYKARAKVEINENLIR